MKCHKISTYVLNYNGASLLLECLPSIVNAQSHANIETELYVIDNGSTDNSLNILENQFPIVKLLQASNRYLCSFNDYVFKDDADIVILMNNDVKVENDFIQPIVKLFEGREDAFLVSPLCLNFSDSQYQGGLSILYKKFGWWGTRSVEPRKTTFPYTISMGVCMAFRRDRFAILGGFDDLFLPGILEDLDIGYRGWKRGWKGYVAVNSVIYHKGQISFKDKFGSSGIKMLAVRNTFLFIWKNISDKLFLLEHFFWIGPRLVYALITGKYYFIKGCFKAFIIMNAALLKKEKIRPFARISDRAIYNLFRTRV